MGWVAITVLGAGTNNTPLALAFVAAIGAAVALFVINRDKRRRQAAHPAQPAAPPPAPTVRTAPGAVAYAAADVENSTTIALASGRPVIDEKLTAFDLFFTDPSTATTEIEDALVERRLLTSLPEEAPRLQRAAARQLLADVADQITSLLQSVPLAETHASCVAQLPTVAAAQTATGADGSSRTVPLPNQQLTYTVSPTIEILVDGTPVPLLHLALAVTFATDAAELVVTAGEITTKIASFVRARAVLTSNGAPLLSK